MRRHLILFFLALFLFISCKDKKKSGNVIEKGEMASMLSEVHMIDGAMALHVMKDSLYKYGTNRYGLLFKKHGVDSALFNKSVKYYAARPDEMMEIYDSITVVLQFKSDSLSKVYAKIMDKQVREIKAKADAENKRKADSVKRDSIKAAAKPIKLKLNQRIK